MTTRDDQEMLAEWLDDTLDDAGCAALALRVRSDADLAEELRGQEAIAGLMRARFVDSPRRERLSEQVMARLAAPTATPSVRRATVHGVLRRIDRRQARRRWLAAGMALAALILIGIAVSLSPVHAPVAIQPTVKPSLGVAPGESVSNPIPGATIAAGDTLRTAPGQSLTATFADGTRVDLGERAEIAVDADQAGHRLRLASGQIGLETNAPLVVASTWGSVAVERGTCSIERERDGLSLTVFTGTTRLIGSDGQHLAVTAGQRARADDSRAPHLIADALLSGNAENADRIFPDAGVVVPPPSGNPSTRCYAAESQPWTGENRQVAVIDFTHGLFSYDPDLEISFDYWLSPGITWAEVWLGNQRDGSFQVLPLTAPSRAGWTHVSAKLGDFHTGTVAPPLVSRRPVRGERIAALGFQTSLAEGGELFIDNVRIGPPQPAPVIPEPTP